MSNNRVLILYYHRINILENDYHKICVTPSNFKQQLQYLKNNYSIVRFEDDWSTLNSDSVVITFDDGYVDNLEYALPVLEELEVPATIFVSTGTMNQDRELWWDELEHLVLIGDNIPTHFQLIDQEFSYQWDTSTPDFRKNCYMSIHHLMKNFIGPDIREEWLKQLWSWRGLKPTARKNNLTVSKIDCRRLAASNEISLGAHTVNHPSLAVLTKEEQENEIRTSVDVLSEVLGRRVTLFSYPFGGYRSNYNDDSIKICQKCGIVKAASTDNALWDSSISPYKIPRKVVRNWEIYEFKKEIKAYWESNL